MQGRRKSKRHAVAVFQIGCLSGSFFSKARRPFIKCHTTLTTHHTLYCGEKIIFAACNACVCQHDLLWVSARNTPETSCHFRTRLKYSTSHDHQMLRSRVTEPPTLNADPSDRAKHASKMVPIQHPLHCRGAHSATPHQHYNINFNLLIRKRSKIHPRLRLLKTHKQFARY